MRLLLVQNLPPHDPRSGGGQRVHDALILALRDMGHDARGAFLTPGGRPADVPYPAWTVPESTRFLGNVLRLRGLATKIVGEWRPDVFYGSAPEAAEALCRLPTGILRVATSHHYDPPDLTEGLRPWRPLHMFGRLRSLQRFYLERRLLRGADLVLATSRFGAEALRERGYLGGDVQVPVLYNGVGDAWLDEPNSGEDGFLFVGRLDAQKGVDILLEALARTRGRWPLAIVGEGWQRDELEGQVKRLGLTNRVSFEGADTAAGVRTRMGRAGALVVPSRAENYPLVVLEGLARRLPVVTTRVGGIPEMVVDGESALLVGPDDPDALAGALDAIEGDAGLRGHLSHGGRKVAESHRWSSVAEQLVAYLRAAGVPRRSAAAL
ncbi:MAG: glycosyltransferase family 4 protein [Gemmatimonadota bacterium]|nr:glycosyltransferase family 4 protein [Gemmatimonadota bacterium]